MISVKQLVGAWRKSRKRKDWRKADAYWHDVFERVHGDRVTLGRDGWMVTCVDPRELVTSAVDRECPPGVGYVAGTEVVVDGKVVKL